MAELSIDVFVSVDGFAFGTRSPGYFGFDGPDLEAWIDEQAERPHRALMGRRTYTVLNELPDEAKDASWERMITVPTTVFSRTLTTVDWPGATLCADDAVDEIRRLKESGGEDMRTIGSLSLARQLIAADLVDHLRAPHDGVAGRTAGGPLPLVGAGHRARRPRRGHLSGPRADRASAGARGALHYRARP